MVLLLTCWAVISNGAVLMPNTFTMQELIRMMVDRYMDDEDAGLQVEIPTIFTIARGKSPYTASW